ncbi:Alpha/Beta hydrolase protein [Plectosphaerella plurivora]|uniref:Alpha/Beta hydrolase protein n=1 Tax=Plectosphaerella plurivora TaxID=936078 RepID=A0A9P9AGD7_9PEZI|nr:Alpha/Beta hydrolase protein [Plectosphaerella plurivora]
MKLTTAIFATFAALAVAAPSPGFKPYATTPDIYEKAPPKLAQVVKTEYVDVKGIKMAYRRFGKQAGLPLVYFCNFRSTMDLTDPLLVNYMALTRQVILFDNVGVGLSEGVIPSSIDSMASSAADFLSVIGVKKTDVLGFSMGGGVAQRFAELFPEVANRVAIAGSIAGQAPGTIETLPSVFQIASGNVTVEQLLGLFFYPSNTSTAAGIDYAGRIFERQVPGEQRVDTVVEPGTTAQLNAILDFTRNPANIESLANMTGPVLVTNGKTDVLAPTVNSFIMQQHLPNAELHIYPDSGHGHLFQFAKSYARSLQTFLDAGAPPKKPRY